MEVQVSVVDRVLKPTADVFDAIIDPDKITKFFASGSSGPMAPGKTITWTFADVGRTISPEVLAVEEDRHIAFAWDASGETARVDIWIEPYDEQSTRLTITEDGWSMDGVGVKRALGQTQGWTDFICCMKGYLQFGVNLRKGRSSKAH
jgi:uncharacterized protein YndB with AHSA1/START domain